MLSAYLGKTPTEMETPLRGEALRILRRHAFVPPWDPVREEGVRARSSPAESINRSRGGRGALHAALARRREAEARVQAVHVPGVQDPAQARVRAVLHRLAHELGAEPAAAVLGQHVDVE